MGLKKILKYSGVIGASLYLGFQAGKFVYTPMGASASPEEKISGSSEKLILESRFFGDRAVLYGSNDDGGWKVYISGEEMSRDLDKKWREECLKTYKEETYHDRFHFRTEWE